MKLTISDRLNFAKEALNKHLGLVGIGLAFIVFGGFFMYLGYRADNGLGFMIFGGTFIMISLAFMVFMLPSSMAYYYEQALTKKYGSYTDAKVTNKRIDDYSHSTGSLQGSHAENVSEFMFVVEFQFGYQQKTYTSESFFNEKSTYEMITIGMDLPIQFLRTDPNIVTLRRRKLANNLGIAESACQ